jgi:pyridoxine 4-dehydrogenase
MKSGQNSSSVTAVPSHLSAANSGEFLVGGDLRINRLGFGAMRITGQGVWGEPRDRAEAKSSRRRCILIQQAW